MAQCTFVGEHDALLRAAGRPKQVKSHEALLLQLEPRRDTIIGTESRTVMSPNQIL